jgi:hypothetical protein
MSPGNVVGSALAAAAIAAVAPASVFGVHAARAPCRPAIFTVADVAAATGYSRPNLRTVPHATGTITPAPGQAAPGGAAMVCDWELVHWNEAGFGEGRVSVFAFASPEDASAWFTAYTSAQTPACKTVAFTTSACIQVSPVPPSGAYPLFEAVQGQYVVSVHMKQRRFNLRPLKALAGRVLARAPY